MKALDFEIGSPCPGPQSILVLGREESLLEVICLVIEHATGHLVRGTMDQGEAIRRLREEPYDLLILSGSMGLGRRGGRILPMVEVEFSGSLPVILSSAYDEKDEPFGDLKQLSGPTWFLPVSILGETLISMIATALDEGWRRRLEVAGLLDLVPTSTELSA